MTRLLPLATLAAMLAAPGTAVLAQRAAPAPPAHDDSRAPTLVVLITVDQMRGDYIDRFGDQLTGGLARLSREGAFYTNAFQDHAITETAPGHASTLSGRFPEHTGIVYNSAGVPDPQAPVIGDSSANASPFRFRGGTLTTWMRIKDPYTRALSVSRKDRGAILPLGRAHQSVFWYDPARGRFSTSTYYADTLPTWLRDFNELHLPEHVAGRAWTPLLDDGYAEPDSVRVENHGTDFTFPHAMPADTAKAAIAIQDTPWMDQITLEAALAGVRAMKLGAGPHTDVLAVSLSSTDAIGHRYGTESRELHDQILRLDRSLGAFLDTLFTLRDSSRVIIALTADHGVAPTPERYTARTHVPTWRVDLRPLVETYRRTLAARGVAPDAFFYEEGMVFADRPRFARAGVRPDSVLAAFAADARRVPGVQRVDRLAALARDTLRDPVARRWIHQVPPDLPVALVVTLRPYSVFGASTGVHGSPHDYDAHVPIIFWGAPFRPGRYGRFVRVVDIAPTLAWVTGTPVTERVDGVVLRDALR
ncbi:MAG TPA: alkaline phosphatase family protein [Gemmatimonadaceae bacterium]